eukprot:360308-Chlamydomonas_euryale.AAC.2
MLGAPAVRQSGGSRCALPKASAYQEGKGGLLGGPMFALCWPCTGTSHAMHPGRDNLPRGSCRQCACATPECCGQISGNNSAFCSDCNACSKY